MHYIRSKAGVTPALLRSKRFHASLQKGKEEQDALTTKKIKEKEEEIVNQSMLKSYIDRSTNKTSNDQLSKFVPVLFG